jgi:hypothetical protein
VLQQNLLEILQSAEPIVKIKLNQMVEWKWNKNLWLLKW